MSSPRTEAFLLGTYDWIMNETIRTRLKTERNITYYMWYTEELFLEEREKAICQFTCCLRSLNRSVLL